MQRSLRWKETHSSRIWSSRRATPTPQYSPLGTVIRLRSPSSPPKTVSPHHGPQNQEGARLPKSWELIPPSEGWMCEGNDVGERRVDKEVSVGVDDAKGNEEGEAEVKRRRRRRRRRIPRRTPPRKRCLLILALWMWTLTRTIYSTWRSFNVILSTLPSIAVRRSLNNPPTISNPSLLMPTVIPTMISPVFGHLQLVRVSRVPHPLLVNERLRLLAFLCFA
ncbi:hypothetical protein PIB30_044907 [Stylosanthes scabra]|uniref:Uncharacterized protein n=1 Tax=Stylosanthes scabra TaxID=79078 RepID=A0ABU6WH48_9FABA|nr:hypothetical protein [Stylosanthes scabra]